MAHARKRGSKWEGRYTGPDHKEHTQGGFARKIDAVHWAQEHERTIRRGEWVAPTKITFEEWAKEWQSITVNLRPKTREAYASHVRVHLVPEFGARALIAIEPSEVRRFFADLSRRRSPSMTNNVFRTMRNMMRSAVDNRRISRSPCEGVRVARATKREVRFLNAAEVDRLASAAGDYAPLIYFAAYTGMRLGEIIALRVRRLDLFGRKVEVAEAASDVRGELHFGPPKNGKTRTLTIPRFLVDMLLPLVAEKDPNDLVFTAPMGGPLRHTNALHRILRPALKGAGLEPKFRFHDLRHTHATLLIANGAHPRSIMDRLGHSSIVVAMDVYGHLLPQIDGELVDGLDLMFQSQGKADAAVVPLKR